VSKVFLFPFDLIQVIQGLSGQVLPASRAGWPIRSAFCAESAHDKDDQADQQKQANPAATDEGTSKVKSAAAKQKKQNQ
jgi:hypothetical protein